MRVTAFRLVTPAQAGIQGSRTSLALGPRFRGDDDDVTKISLIILPA
jgi:hypothetical protein